MRYTHSLIIRVVLALLLLTVPTGIFHTNLFQAIFGTATLKLTYMMLKMANVEVVIGNYGVRHAIDLFGQYTVDIVKYCVTAPAYYFYTLLVILVYGVSIWKRIELLILGYFAIFAMNLVRILILVVMLVEKGPDYFTTAHDILGTMLSIFYVIIIWVIFSLGLKVKNIPIITDIKILLGEIMNQDEV